MQTGYELIEKQINMRASLVVAAMVLFTIWVISIRTFDVGDMVHSFLIGSVILFMIRFMYFKKIV